MVSRWLPTAVAWVWARVRSHGICGGQSGTGVGFLQARRFPLPIFIPPVAPQSPSSIIWDWYSSPVVSTVPSGLSFTPLRIIIIRLKLLITLLVLCKKVKLSLCLSIIPCKASFLKLAPDSGEWSVPQTGCFTVRKRTPSTY
jgi:cyanate permease